jgi:L-lactate dehydrogenase complex protein LldG
MSAPAAPQPGAGSLAGTFAEALRARGGTPHLVPDQAAAAQVVAQLCAGQRVVVDDDPVLAPYLDGLDLVPDPWEADVGLTTALAAAASTSTLALAFDAGHRRRTALVPPVHVAVLPTQRLVPDYGEVLAALARVRPAPSGMRLVSGPSSSGDIEQVHIRGMHGPVQVHVVVVGEPEHEAHAEPADRRDTEPVAEPVRQAAPDAAPGAAGRTPR